MLTPYFGHRWRGYFGLWNVSVLNVVSFLLSTKYNLQHFRFLLCHMLPFQRTTSSRPSRLSCFLGVTRYFLSRFCVSRNSANTLRTDVVIALWRAEQFPKIRTSVNNYVFLFSISYSLHLFNSLVFSSYVSCTLVISDD